MVRGHTQNEGDAVHSVIEQSLKRAKKSGPIYVPEQYVSIIRSAKKKGLPLEVKELNYTSFFNIKAFYEESNMGFLKDVAGNEFKINDVRVLNFNKGSDIVRYNTTYEESEWNVVQFRPKKRRPVNLVPIGNYQLKTAYQKQLLLGENKRKDLKYLMDGNIIPQFYKHFFEPLF